MIFIALVPVNYLFLIFGRILKIIRFLASTLFRKSGLLTCFLILLAFFFRLMLSRIILTFSLNVQIRRFLRFDVRVADQVFHFGRFRRQFTTGHILLRLCSKEEFIGKKELVGNSKP